MMLAFDDQPRAGGEGECGCVIPTFCDFKMLRLWEPKMRTFCACRILEFDDSMMLNGAAGKSCSHLPC